ncbi:SHOCT domain-containing protein [uncultured Salinibacterium sp.]|uniref:SHOCT domain-containing protein n=1 Tax=uncultured Salinibacterium sp. TaxID=459274 RepID=UPI0030DA9419
MSDAVPIAPGWYPDPATGGTRYWEGSRWTGDVRPRRKPFAASSKSGVAAIIAIWMGVGWLPLGIGAYSETGQGGYIVAAVLIPLVAAVVAVYFLRGKGPSTQEVEARLAQERKEAKAKRRDANIAGFAANMWSLVKPRPEAAPASGESAASAQINAIADPETAKALLKLQNLQYTRTITDDEFQAAKDKLLGPVTAFDSFSQIEKLAELHEAGILGDVEFASAKAKALGI